MNKKLIALAVAGVISGYGTAVNAAATVSGFADLGYYLADETKDDSRTAAVLAGGPANKNAQDSTFYGNGEIDVVTTVGAVTTRLDVNLDTTTTGTSGSLEQAFFAWDMGAVTLIGGVFNNPMGADVEDKPEMEFNSNSVVYKILDNQTAGNRGNNLEGVALTGMLGPVTLTGAFLDDIGAAAEENSLALVANYTPMAGLDLELGLITQDDQMNTATPSMATTAGDVIDFNVTYSTHGATVGLDYLSASNIIDSAYTLWLGYDFGKFKAKIRTENVSFDAAGSADHEVNTIYGSYKAADNLSIALEVRDADRSVTAGTAAKLYNNDAVTGVGQGTTTTLKFTATF